jgi:hypothetical protein
VIMGPDFNPIPARVAGLWVDFGVDMWIKAEFP